MDGDLQEWFLARGLCAHISGVLKPITLPVLHGRNAELVINS